MSYYYICHSPEDTTLFKKVEYLLNKMLAIPILSPPSPLCLPLSLSRPSLVSAACVCFPTTIQPAPTFHIPFCLILCFFDAFCLIASEGPQRSSFCLSSNPWTPQELVIQLLLYCLSLHKVWDFAGITVFCVHKFCFL